MLRIDSKTHILVYGLGKSGTSAINYLLKSRGNVTITDDKPFYDLRYILEPYLEVGARFIPPVGIGFSVCDFDLIVLSPGVTADKPFLNLARACKIPVISDIELAYEQMKVSWIAVTGTNGKTTTTSVIGDIFRRYYPKVIVAGNIGEPICDYIHFAYPAQYVIAEVSSYQLEYTYNFKPTIGIVLNISADHIQRHKSMEEYVRIKKKILENQDENDFLILNYDDPIVRGFSMTARSKVLFYSTDTVVLEGAFIKNRQIVVRILGKETQICSLDLIPLIGKHNIGNIMASALASFISDIPVKDIQFMIKGFKPLPHRLEYLGKSRNVEIYNDSKATNMDALARALESFKKPIVLIAGGEDKGGPLNEVVQIIQKKVKNVVLFGKNVSRLQEAIWDVPVESYESLQEAVKNAWKKTSQGEILLFSPGGSSFDKYKDFEQRGDDFKNIVSELVGNIQK